MRLLLCQPCRCIVAHHVVVRDKRPWERTPDQTHRSDFHPKQPEFSWRQLCIACQRCRCLLRVALPRAARHTIALPPYQPSSRHRIVLLSEFLYKLRLHFSSPRHFANDFIVPRVENRLFAVGTQWNLLFGLT